MSLFTRKKKLAKSIADIPPPPMKLLGQYDQLSEYLRSDVEQTNKLHGIYDFLDELWNFLYPYLSCKKGCSYCCSIPVDVFSIEAENISKEIGKKILVHPVSNKYSPCPFLKNDKCSIYKNRPFKCRTYFPFEGPEFCKNQESRANFYNAIIDGENLFNKLELEVANMSKRKGADIREFFSSSGN